MLQTFMSAESRSIEIWSSSHSEEWLLPGYGHTQIAVWKPVNSQRHIETFARKMISLSGKAKTHGMREFMLINDRLSTILTQHAGEMAFVQRSHIKAGELSPYQKVCKQVLATPSLAW